MLLNMSMQYKYKLFKNCGKETFISRNVEIRRPHLISIGNHAAIDSGFYCTIKADIGDYVHIGPYVSIVGGIDGYLKMGNFSTIAAGCRLICVSDEHLGEGLVGPTIPKKYQDRHIIAPIIFESFASIATNVVVFPGVTLGEGSVVGACSLVTKSTKPWTIYRGIPAKPIKQRIKEKIIEMSRNMGYSY